ncbi:efflux RND transporter permease subunit, partial [bacterium]|nr:efflux RND transporter permease subunit [bacterium]
RCGARLHIPTAIEDVLGYIDFAEGDLGGTQIEDRAGRGLSLLDQVTQEILLAGQSQSTLTALNSTFRPGVPQLFIDIDRRKVSSLNVALDSLFATLQATLGSTYVNDFNKFGRIYQVRVQADQPFRSQPSDIERLVVRSRDGKMVPVGAFAQVQRSFGPQVINRYNLFPSAVVSGEPAPGVSTGDALDLMEQVATNVLPDSMEFEWTGMAYQERKTGGEAVLVFSLAVILVYFVLAAQYESWALPFAVILVVPLGLLGAVGLTSLRGMDNNIYSQVGMVLIIALASKNAILIVEFATDLRRSGAGIREAAIEAARLRFRPILMTSLAFILGVLPLAFANGAGANGQRSLGTAVLGGMITATVLAVFFVPTFFVVIESITSHRLRGRRSPTERPTNVPEQASPSITTTV